MTIEETIAWLKQNGYKHEQEGREGQTITHYLYKRSEGSDCQCNGRPPNIGFEIFSHPEGDSISVKIRAEAINGQWVDVGYYSMDVDMVKELSTLEYTVTKMWECAN